MAHNPSVKTAVRRFYVFDRFTLEQAAERASVSFNTARRWKNEAKASGDDWDKARDVQIMAGGEMEDLSQSLLTGFLVQYRSTMDEIQGDTELSSKEKTALLSCLADSFTKMTAASKRILPDVVEIEVAVRAIMLFGDYLQDKYPQLIGEFSDALNGFQSELERNFKSKR